VKVAVTAAIGAAIAMAAPALAQDSSRWVVHDTLRPAPSVVEAAPGAPPADAIVLLRGSDRSQWRMADGSPARWKAGEGYMEVAPGTGDLVSLRAFGDCQLHVEWATPVPPRGEGQGRGNSGVFLMGLYEIQVLDSYRNRTYSDGQAAAIYGQAPPLVNASRPPGEWQTYDIVFRRPRFGRNGRLVSPARITVLHNGVLVHDGVKLSGPTAHGERAAYAAHADRLPIRLQDHEARVRYRNIWVRELPER
jgi:hypothetical protein